MKTLILGASGATGKHLTEQLLAQGNSVKVMVRSAERAPESWKHNDRVEIVTASVSDLSPDMMAAYLKDCDAVASCLGHNISFKRIYGKPRKLVRNSIHTVCKAIEQEQTGRKVKVVLMNTSGNRNRDLHEKIPLGHRIIVALLRVLLPPHPDNEQAADHLRKHIGQNHPRIEWVAVRPDGLIDEDEVTGYTLHPSPVRDPIFNAGKTSRINVGNFMARLINEDPLWQEWKGRMPVIYNVPFGEVSA